MNFKKKILLYFIAISVFATSMYTDSYAAVNADGTTTPAADGTTSEPIDSQLNKRINSSVNKLLALGIVEGKSDGLYHPEDNLSREQFTKIMVELLGMGDAVDAAPKKPIFKDVFANGWSAGYINLAASQGIISGYGDGKFMPQEKVTLAQAVTVILRSIGYRDDFLKGEWPNNYILKATELGLLDGIEIGKDSIINRGIAALLINNAMDIEVIKSYPDGRGYYVTDITLLEDKQNLYKLEKVELREQEKTNHGMKVSIEFTGDTYFKNDKYQDGNREDFLLTNEFSSELYIGIEADIYIDEDDKILYVDYDDLEDYGNTVFVNEIVINEYNEKPAGKIKLSRNDDYIEVTDDSEIYVNGEEIDEDEFESYLGEDVFGTFIIDDEELIYADLISWEEKNLYIESIDNESKDTLYTIDTGEGNEREIEAKDFSDGYKVYLIEEGTKTEITFADLLAGDVINISEEQETNEELIYVWRNSAQGRFERLAGGNYGQRIFFFLKGLETKYHFADDFSFSYNNGKKISREKDETVTGVNKLGEFYNEQVKVYNNWRNEVVYMQGNFKTNSDLYGIFRNYVSDAEGKIQIFTKTGSITTYAFEELEEYERMKAYNVPIGSLIKYSIGKSKKLKNLSDNIEDDIIKIDDNIQYIREGDDFGSDYAVIDGKKINVDSDTAYYDYTSHSAYTLDDLKWSKFKNKQVLEDVEVIAEEEDGVLKVLAIWDNMEGIKEDPIAGYVLNQYRLGDKNYVEVQSGESESVTQYQINEDYDELFLNGRVVLYGIDSDNKFKLVEDDEIEFVSGEVESADNSKIYIDGERYRISDETQVFRGYEKVSSNHLRKADLAAIYVEDGVVLAAEILDSEEAESFGEGTLIDIDSGDENCFTIEIGGKKKEFSKNWQIDYVFRDNYLKVADKNQDITEALEEKLGGDEPFVKFMYNNETDEIYSIWIDD